MNSSHVSLAKQCTNTAPGKENGHHERHMPASRKSKSEYPMGSIYGLTRASILGPGLRVCFLLHEPLPCYAGVKPGETHPGPARKKRALGMGFHSVAFLSLSPLNRLEAPNPPGTCLSAISLESEHQSCGTKLGTVSSHCKELPDTQRKSSKGPFLPLSFAD